MAPHLFRIAACASATAAVAVGVAGCGGSTSAKSASNKASGLTVVVAGDQVTLKRSATSTAGTAGVSGQIACTDDYRKLLTAKAEPAPTQAWYAVTLITWPGAQKQSTATLSHSLKDPELCVVQTADSSTQVVVYFRPGVKTDTEKLQQALQASAALKAAAHVAASTVKTGSFPTVSSLVKTLAAQGLYVKQAATLGDVTDVGTIYLITPQTTKNMFVAAVKGETGDVDTVTQGVKGSPKITTAKS